MQLIWAFLPPGHKLILFSAFYLTLSLRHTDLTTTLSNIIKVHPQEMHVYLADCLLHVAVPFCDQSEGRHMHIV